MAAKGETLKGFFLSFVTCRWVLWHFDFLFIFGAYFADNIKTIEDYLDIIVMHHFQSGAARRAAATTSIPIINAGDVPGQHLTQVCRVFLCLPLVYILFTKQCCKANNREI